MSIITYAQNFEDVMLWRALKQVDHGFYIDAGGYSPTVDSVTKLFYDRGWHGINIEPNPHLFPAFQQQRPHDINLQVAVGDCEAFLPFTIIMAPEDVPNNGGLSTLEQDIAEKDAKAGMKVERIIVPVKTIKTIWKEHVPKGQPVHFFKIDVEGFEKKTIQGNNWTKSTLGCRRRIDNAIVPTGKLSGMGTSPPQCPLPVCLRRRLEPLLRCRGAPRTSPSL